jgi:hypothetical protein
MVLFLGWDYRTIVVGQYILLQIRDTVYVRLYIDFVSWLRYTLSIIGCRPMIKAEVCEK